MKRKREEIEKKTEIQFAIEELSLLIKIIRRSKINYANNNNNDDNNNIDNNNQAQPTVGVAETTDADNLRQQRRQQHHHHHHQQQFLRVDLNIPTKPFLAVCTLMIQVLDKIGPTMAVMRQDIYNNIQRLEMVFDSDPTTYSNLVEILNKEAVERCAKKGDSCSKALLWLTRSLDFTAALLQKLVVEPREESMEQIVADSYETTLKPWHGWIAATAYKVALKLVPETDTFICLLMDKGENIDNFRDEIQAFISLLVSLLEDLHSTLNSFGLERLKST